MECFTVYTDEVEGRIDPFYYKPLFVKLIRKIKKSNFGFVRFGEIIQDISGGATPRIEGDFYSYSGIPFLRVQNITEEGINLEDVKFIKKEVHEKMLKRSQLHENELVFTITGRIGSVAVVPKNFAGNINQHSVRIKLKEYFNNNQILPEYIALFFNLKIGQILSFRETTGGTRPALDYEAIKDLVIPFPDMQKQKELVDKTKQVYSLKQSKEAEALKLLDSLNDYVLDELGIKLPELKDKMVYIVNSEDVQNKRADAYYYQPKFEELEKAIKKGKFEVIVFDKLITDLKNGVEIRTYSENGYRYLRVTDLGKCGVNDNDPRYVVAEEIPPKIRLGNNSFLISRSGSLGLVSTVKDKIINCILSSHIFKVDLDTDKITPEYLEAFFRSILGQIQFFRNNNGGVVPEIDQSALKSLTVVIPPLSIQNKIAEEVKARMKKAEQLQKEAKEELDRAKQEVEKMILGNVVSSPIFSRQ